MNGVEKLGVAAGAVNLVVLLAFVPALFSRGGAGEKYRDTVMNLGQAVMPLLTFLAGKCVGLAAFVVAPRPARIVNYADRQQATFVQRVAHYRYIRTYKGEHREGVASLKWQRA